MTVRRNLPAFRRYYISGSILTHGHTMRSTYTSRSATLLAIIAVAAAAACGDRSSQHAGGTPAREIQLAPSAPAEPQLNDAPIAAAAAPAPKKPAPKPAAPVAKAPAAPERAQEQVVVRPLSAQDNPAPVVTMAAPAAAAPAPSAPPAPAMGTVSAGTMFAVHPIARVCTKTFKPGDRFTTTLTDPVAGTDGAMIPAGSTVVLRVDQATRSENGNDSLRLSFGVVSLRVGQQSYDVSGHVTQTTPLERVRVQSTADQAKKVGAGAVIGALAGQLLGRNTKSTVMGGAVGAAAGAAVAAGTADYDGCVPANAVLTVNLDAPLRIKLLPN
jgi:hypothetical protein